MSDSFTVKLTYFRRRGKYYSEGEYSVPGDLALHQIWDQVERRRDSGNLPGLVHGAKEYHILINVPGHPHEHPRFLMLP